MSELKTDKLSEHESALLAEISAAELWRHAEELARWEKISGTPGERAAVAYLRQQLAAIGLETTLHEFECLLGWPEEARIDLVAPERRSYRTITHSYAPSSPEEGVEASVVYVGAGEEAQFRVSQLRGRIALVEGIASPVKVLRGQRAGVAGMIFIQEDRLHEMCVSPVWGTPTPRTAPLLPNMPIVSVERAAGEEMKSLVAEGEVAARLKTRTFWGWRTTPLLVGELKSQANSEQFVLLSGHHCSWYFGAMDNGTANATMLEVIRVLAAHRGDLARSVRVAFWPGHTQGRYAGSTWYFDNFWEDMHENCVLHVNADSTGARGATIYKALSMPETQEFATAAIVDAIGAEPEAERQSRAGDQSFWSCGVPSIYMDLSQVPAEMAARAGSASLFTAADHATKHKASGLPWWWHTPDDTIDKIDPDVLERDTRVYLLATYRAAAAGVLPFRYEPAARQLRETIQSYQEAAGGRVDLSPVLDRALRLEGAARDIDTSLQSARSSSSDQFADALNRELMAMDRELVMVNFTSAGPFDQDLAIPIPAVPLLEPARRLKDLDADSNEARYLATELIRNRNKVAYHLGLALAAAGRVSSLLRDRQEQARR